MKKKILGGFTLALIILIATMAYNRKPSVNELLKQDWRYVSATDLENNILETPDKNSTLSLSNQFTFSNVTSFETGFEKGLWRFKDSTLILTVDYTADIDSVSYIVEANKPMLIYYKDNKEISRVVDGIVSNNQKVVRMQVEQCDLESLVLVHKDKRYSFEKVAVHAAFANGKQKLGFSFTAILRGLLGLLTIIGISWLFSANRKAINWKVVGIGLCIQILLAFGILKVPFIATFFEFIGKIFVVILDFTRDGSVFLLGDLMNIESYGFIFAFQVLPTIIFFSALTSLLFYLGVIQKIVYALAWLMTKAMKLSGAESLSVAGNIFLGQTESPLLIKAYLEKMNKSEIMLVMSGGMATLAGGVLAAYIAFLGGSDPIQRLYFAKHLLAASIMAAPGVVIIAKILVPQTEKINTDVEVSKDKIGSNVLDAISNGTGEGLKLAVNVAAMLLTFIAFIAMFNFILTKVGAWTGLNEMVHNFDPQYDSLNLKFVLGYIFAPIVWLMGVVKEDVTLVGRLIGEKLILTEFIAYVSLADLKQAGAFISQKSIIMSTYALCGFANFASIGIQIGGIGSLAPGKRKQLSELGMRALLAGSLASLVSATIVGMILG